MGRTFLLALLIVLCGFSIGSGVTVLYLEKQGRLLYMAPNDRALCPDYLDHARESSAVGLWTADVDGESAP